MRGKRNPMGAGSCDNQAIRRISVKGARQTVESDDDFDIERQNIDNTGRGGIPQPKIKGAIEG